MKKLLSVILSLTMLVTTVAVMPFTALASDVTLEQLSEICNSYKQMVSSKIYTNEQAAYTAYENAVQAIDAVKYGGKAATNFGTLKTELETAIGNMKEFNPEITSYIPKSPASNVPVDSASCSNLLYHGGLTTEVGNGDKDYVMTGVYMGDIVWAYDGVHDLYAPVNSWQRWQKNFLGSTNYKCRYVAITSTTDIALKDNWWQSKKTINDFYTRENCPDGQDLSSKTGELEMFIFGDTSTYKDKTNYIASNTLKFNTDLSKDNYKKYNLTWQAENNYNNTHSYVSTSSIYVINYKQLLDATKVAMEKLKDVDSYTRNTMTAYLGILDNATSYDISKYNYEEDTLTAVTNAATDINYKAREITESSLTKVADYADLRTAIINASALINAGQGIYTDDSWNNLVAKYSNAQEEMGKLENPANDYLTIDNQNRVATLISELDAATTELQVIETNIDFDVDGDTAVIKSIDNDGETVINIPSSIGAYDKVAIAAGAFSNDAAVEQVNIPESVQSVGDNAFTNCPKLNVVYVYGDTTTFGKGVFTGSATPLTIKCNPNSEAWKYAQANGYQYSCLNHTYDDGAVSVAATCTENGTMKYTCKDCGATKKETIAATGHNCTKTQTVAPTCEKGGYDLYECANCSYSYKDNYTSTLGGHNWVVTTSQPATCQAGGYADYQCSKCNETKHEVLTKIDHNYNVNIRHVGATCTTNGYDIYKCATCDQTVKLVDDEDPATGVHDYKAVVTPATCAASGYTTYTCTKCGNSYVDDYTSPTGEHNYTSVVTPATCKAGGYTTYTCTKCGTSYIDNKTDSLPHTKGTAIEVVQPTCTSNGYTKYVCTVCGQTFDGDIVAKSEHSYTSVVTPATCTVGGYTTYTCTKCGTSYIDDKTDPLPHTKGTAIEVVQPTCTSNGYTKYVCTVCGQTFDGDIVPHTEHSYTTVVTPATCTSGGYTTYTCTKCGHSYVDDYTSPTGVHVYASAVTPATCTSGGYTTYTCTKCGSSYVGNNTAALGHTSVATSLTPATTTADGAVTAVCNVCHAVVSQTAIPMVKTVKLNTTAYSYNNKKHVSGVTVKDSTGRVLVKGVDYTVKCSNSKSKKVGYYTETITFMGNYTGSQTLAYTIGPKTTEKITSLKAGKKAFTVKYKKNNASSGYIIQYSTSSKFTSGVKTVTVKSKKTASKTIKKLKKGKKYYVRVCAYKTVKGKKCLAAWSKTKTVKAK